MDIVFSATNALDFFTTFAEQFDAKAEKNRFTIPAHMGKGNGLLVEVEEGLSFFVYDIQLNKPSKFKRKGIDISEYFPIICWFSHDEIEQEIDGEKKLISKDSQYGIFLASPKIDFSYTIPAKSRVIIITITISPVWLQKNLNNKKNSNFLKLIESGKPFAIYEEISFNMGQYLEKLKELQHGDIVSLVHLKSYVLNFLASFISAVENRTASDTISKINHQDVKKLFEIRHILTTEFTSHHEIKTLAANAAMSERKLQSLFKEVFGITIYQYALKVKMEEAKKMIETRKYTISEVGYKIGYSNLSHFTAAFKKHVGINPKQYLLKLQ